MPTNSVGLDYFLEIRVTAITQSSGKQLGFTLFLFSVDKKKTKYEKDTISLIIVHNVGCL